jgi:hypothetical protein
MLTRKEIVTKIKLIDDKIEVIENGLDVHITDSKERYINTLKEFKATLKWSLANYDEETIKAKIIELENGDREGMSAAKKIALMKVFCNDSPDFEKLWNASKCFD